MSEAREQAKLLKSLRALGVPAQKFNDYYSVGVPDMFIGASKGWEPFGLPNGGMWLEAKYRELPVKPATPLLGKDQVTGNQKHWLNMFDGRPCLSAVILFTGKGWLVCPISCLQVLTDLPGGEVRSLLQTTTVSRITPADLWRSYLQVKAYGRVSKIEG